MNVHQFTLPETNRTVYTRVHEEKDPRPNKQTPTFTVEII